MRLATSSVVNGGVHHSADGCKYLPGIPDHHCKLTAYVVEHTGINYLRYVLLLASAARGVLVHAGSVSDVQRNTR